MNVGIFKDPKVLAMVGLAAGISALSLIMNSKKDSVIEESVFNKMFDARIAEMVEKGVIFNVKPK